MSRTLALRFSGPLALAESHRRLADQALLRERYLQARRHYRAALKLSPRCADLRAGLARAWEDDPQGSDEKACKQYARAVRGDFNDAMLQARYGRAAGRVGQDETARRALRRALRLAPQDARVLEVVLEAHREAGRLKLAHRLATAARFRLPKSVAVAALWNRSRFDLEVRRQSRVKRADGRATLPFLRIHEGTSIWRRDEASEAKPHFKSV